VTLNLYNKKQIELIDNFYNEFVSKVAAGRKRNSGEILPLATGEVWLGDEAKNLGLVDQLGGLEDALNIAKELANLKPDCKVIEFPISRSIFDAFKKKGDDDVFPIDDVYHLKQFLKWIKYVSPFMTLIEQNYNNDLKNRD